MKVVEHNGSIEVWLEHNGKVYMVQAEPPAYQVSGVYRYVGDNSYEISNFDIIEPINQMRVTRILKEIRQCQVQP